MNIVLYSPYRINNTFIGINPWKETLRRLSVVVCGRVVMNISIYLHGLTTPLFFIPFLGIWYSFSAFYFFPNHIIQKKLLLPFQVYKEKIEEQHSFVMIIVCQKFNKRTFFVAWSCSKKINIFDYLFYHITTKNFTQRASF